MYNPLFFVPYGSSSACDKKRDDSEYIRMSKISCHERQGENRRE